MDGGGSRGWTCPRGTLEGGQGIGRGEGHFLRVRVQLGQTLTLILTLSKTCDYDQAGSLC